MKTQSGIVAVRGTAAATFLCALLLTGCISVKGPEEPDPGTGEDAIEYWTEQAREWGAGEEQIQVLENAAAAGVVTSADVDQVTQALYQCYENAGLEYSGRMEEATTGSDVWFPAAQVVVPEELGEDPSGKLTEMMNACEDEHSIWLVSAYINQPSSRAKMDAVWTTDATRACLEQHGSTAARSPLTPQSTSSNCSTTASASRTPCDSLLPRGGRRTQLCHITLAGSAGRDTILQRRA